MYKRNHTLRKEYLCYNVVDNNSIDDKTYDKLIIHMSTRYKLMFDANIILYWKFASIFKYRLSVILFSQGVSVVKKYFRVCSARSWMPRFLQKFFRLKTHLKHCPVTRDNSLSLFWHNFDQCANHYRMYIIFYDNNLIYVYVIWY